MRRSKNYRNVPYWNFWRVVFAGWIIRYPKFFLRLLGIPCGIIIVVIYNAVTK